MSNRPTLNIAFCCDDHFLIPASIMLESLLKNNSKHTIIAHTFSNNLNQNSIIILKTLLRKYEGRLETYTLSEDIEKELIKWPLPLDYLSVAAYYRIFLPFIISSEVDQLLYLDCDILVRKDISKYFDYCSNNYIMGCSDTESIINCKRLGIKKYINSGVILFNLKQIRKDFSLEKVLVVSRDSLINKGFLGDQDMINLIYQEKIKLVNDSFNFQNTVHKKYSLTHPKELKNAEIAHFIGRCKPWQKDYIFPFTLEYYRYYRKKHPLYRRLLYWIYKPVGLIISLMTHLKWKYQKD